MLDRSLNVHFTAPSSNTMPRTSDGLPLSATTLGLGFDGDSITRDLAREGTTTASGRIDEGFGGVSRGRSSRSNGGLGAVWRGIGATELAGISSTPADTPSARALRLVRWVVCWPRFKINRLVVGGPARRIWTRNLIFTFESGWRFRANFGLWACWCASVRHCGKRRVRVHADAALSRGRRCESLSAPSYLRLSSLLTLEFVACFKPAADNRQRTSACDISAYPGRGNTFEFFHPGARRPPTGAGAVL